MTPPAVEENLTHQLVGSTKGATVGSDHGLVLVAWVQFVGRRVVWCLVGVQRRSGSGEQVGIFRASKPPQSAPGGKTCKKRASEAFSSGRTEEQS